MIFLFNVNIKCSQCPRYHLYTGNESNKALGSFSDDDRAEEAEKNAAPKTKSAVRYYGGGVNPKTSKVCLQ